MRTLIIIVLGLIAFFYFAGSLTTASEPSSGPKDNVVVYWVLWGVKLEKPPNVSDIRAMCTMTDQDATVKITKQLVMWNGDWHQTLMFVCGRGLPKTKAMTDTPRVGV